MGLHIRDGRANDAQGLRALLRQTGVAGPFWSQEELKAVLVDRTQTLLVALDGGTIVAAAHLHVHQERGLVRYLAFQPGGKLDRLALEMISEAGLWLASRGAGGMFLAAPAAQAVSEDVLASARFNRDASGDLVRILDRACQAS